MCAIAGAVNIPAGELATRTHELPSRHRPIRVADVGAAARDALERLRAGGRRAEFAGSFEFAPPGGVPRPGRLWTPTEFLAESVRAMQPARALDVACGNGRDAVFLADCGWVVMAADILPDALALGAALERRYVSGRNPIRWLRVDFETADGPAAVDGRPQRLDFGGSFDLISVFRYLHRPLMPILLSWLAPGGVLLYETFTTQHRERHGKPSRAAHVLRPGELRGLAPAAAVSAYDEAWRGDGSHTARLAVRRAPR